LEYSTYIEEITIDIEQLHIENTGKRKNYDFSSLNAQVWIDL
jgi:hypothetical protein